MGGALSKLSMVRVTWRVLAEGAHEVPAKMTSSIFSATQRFGALLPMTQGQGVDTFDFPDPLGPTTQDSGSETQSRRRYEGPSPSRQTLQIHVG